MKKLIISIGLLLSFYSYTYAQDYYHYLMSWEHESINYLGLLAVNQAKNSAVLRVRYYNPFNASESIIQQNYRFEWSQKYNCWYLKNTRTIDPFTGAFPSWYAPDEFFFIENEYGYINQIWNIDGNLGNPPILVYCEFLNYRQLDSIKYFFYP